MTPSKPKLGQNFLNDTAAIERIADALGDLSTRTVIEIGPGAGAITHALAARAQHLIAVEIDPALAAGLHAVFLFHKDTWVLEHATLDPAPQGQHLVELDSFAKLCDIF